MNSKKNDIEIIYSRLRKHLPGENGFATNLLMETPEKKYSLVKFILGEGNLDNGWVVRIYYNPLVIWIWIGALVIFLGGVISMTSNLKRSSCYRCKHLNEDEVSCKAFPNVIPREILLAEVPHIKPYEGDNGILFEEKSKE